MSFRAREEHKGQASIALENERTAHNYRFATQSIPNKLWISAKNATTQQLYTASFTLDQLRQNGFGKQQTLEAIIKTIQRALATSGHSRIDYMNADGKTRPRYEKGDQLVLSILGPHPVNATLVLSEMDSSDIHLLWVTIEKLQSENTNLKRDMNEMTKQMDDILERVKKAEEEIKEIHTENDERNDGIMAPVQLMDQFKSSLADDATNMPHRVISDVSEFGAVFPEKGKIPMI